MINFKKYVLLLISLFSFFLGQTVQAQTINYVQEDVILTAGATNDSQVNSLGVGSIQTTKTYLDGLGRPVQKVAVQASPNSNKDIVQVAAYNYLGQQPVTYLPYTDNTNNYATGTYRTTGITDQNTYYQNSGGAVNKVANDAQPYNQKIFENSPLRRLLDIGDVGAGFQPTSGQHYKSYVYRSNTAADNVLMFGADGMIGNSNNVPDTYPANSLSCTVRVKEDGFAATAIFKDISGRTVLKRQVLTATKSLDTYYVYNTAGSLWMVIPPAAITFMYQINSFGVFQGKAPQIDKLIFFYHYDNLGRLTSKVVPVAGTTTYLYDPFNRPVLIQDAVHKTLNQWYYIKYDNQGRPISQGIYVDNGANNGNGNVYGMQSFVNSSYANYSYETRSSTAPNYYTNQCFPTANADGTPLTDLAYSYYDDYFLTQNSTTTGSTPDFQYNYQGLPNEAATGAATPFTRGLLTVIRKRTVGSGLNNIWLTNAFFYDKKGNTIQTQSNNQLGSASGGTVVTDYKTNVVDFIGKPMVNLTKKNAGTAGSISVKTTFTYDTHNIRLRYVDQVYNNQASVRIASYEYNEMGQLVKKNLEPNNNITAVPANINLGPTNSVSSTSNTTTIATNSITFSPGASGTTGTASAFIVPNGAYYHAYIAQPALQSVDYRYNIRGQIVNINNSTLTNDNGATNNDSNDLFGMQVMYDQPDVALNSSQVTINPLYNGKISAVKWMTVDNNFRKTNERSYVYSYDEVGRLTQAQYAERASGSSSSASFGINQSGFDESGITYDDNGNITALNRNSSSIGASGYTQVDQLIYSYRSDSPNQLNTVSDNNNSTNTQFTGFGFRNITGSTAPYVYDAGGNLTSDPYEGLTIGYNILNKTDKIQVVNGANGVAITGKYINYTYDAAGVVIRKQQYDNVNGSSSLINTTDYIDGYVYVNQSLSYLPMGEGRVMYSAGTLTPEYIIADQQGNARFSFQDNGNGQVKIIQENSYYAFGLALANSPISMPATPNKLLYNGGSEWQNDYSNLPDYYQTLNRNYDAALGRFISVDPMAETSFSRSVYHYSKNDPIDLNDPSGNDPGDNIFDGSIFESGFDTQAESGGSSTSGNDATVITDGSQIRGASADQIAAVNASIAAGNSVYTQPTIDGTGIDVYTNTYVPGGYTTSTFTIPNATDNTNVDANQGGTYFLASGSVIGETTPITALTTYYPPNNGFAEPPTFGAIPKGTVLSRFGASGYNYSKPGYPSTMRSLPSENNLIENIYTVAKEGLEGWIGSAASWFGQLGGAPQITTVKSTQEMLDDGTIINGSGLPMETPEIIPGEIIP